MPDIKFSILELTAAVMALVYYKKYVQSTERYFLHFLWFTFFIDTIIGPLFSFLELNNTWIYYGYTGISFLFYYWWYHTILKNKLHKKMVVILSALFIIAMIINGIKIELQQYSFVIGASFLLIMISFYLRQLFNSDHILNLKYKLSFWFTVALLLFNISMIPFILLSNYFNVWVTNTAFDFILLFLNVFLYGSYIIGFLWTKKKYNHF